MSLPETFSNAEARNILLAAQGLTRLPERPAQKADVLAAVRRMKALQIDTIHVINRSPYLVLWSRLGDFNPDWLDELLAEGALFEFWAHALCFLPVEDFPLFRRIMLDGVYGWSSAAKWMQEHPQAVQLVRERIRSEGGLRSADFENHNRPPGGWWNWKDEKTALECLFIIGELMIARRKSFQRVYDLRERVLPGWDDGPAAANVPDRESVLRALTLKAVEALGIVAADWASDYFRLPKTGNLARLESLAEQGRIRRVKIEGLNGPAFIHSSVVDAPPSTLTTLLSPFDPVVWDRKRLKDLFGFEYQIECYTPAAKRRYGYFTLPILHHGAVVGRLDPKAHRAGGIFEVKTLYLEPGVAPSDELVAGLSAGLHRLAAWHGTPELVIRRSEPDGLAQRVLEFT